MKVHLVDGTYELFRAYYGSPKRKGPGKREVGATRGFLRSMASLLSRDEVTHAAVAFDHVVESFRNDMFDGYKTGEGIEEALAQQFELVERAAAALGMVVWPMIEFEADDAIASAAVRFAKSKKVEQVVMCSPDKDLAQVVRGETIVAYDRMRDRLYDEAGVVEKFGVGPKSIADYLALVGDAADGIPGIARWGAKSTSLVLAHYETIDKVPADPETWAVKVRGAKSLAENLNAARDDAALYKELAILRTDVKLPETLAGLRWKGPDLEALELLCEEIGDARFMERARALG